MEDKHYRILVVDDEADLCEILQFNLEAEGYRTDVAYSAEEALTLDIAAYDLLLLDVMMGEMSGFEMARRVKDNPLTKQTPIIFLTARDTENDTVEGLNLGADDYISKPFSLREVLARVKAVLRRTSQDEEAQDEEGVIRFQGLVLDDNRKEVWVDGEHVALTRIEYSLLLMMLENRGEDPEPPAAHQSCVAPRRDRARPHRGRQHHAAAPQGEGLRRAYRDAAGVRLRI